MNWPEAAIRWYVTLAATTWAFAPAVRLLCPSLGDRGASSARPLAMLFLIFPTWFLASIGVSAYSTTLLAATIAVGAAIGWIRIVRGRSIDRAWLRAMAVSELMALLAFASYLWLRGFTPAIVGTEKPMDVAFLASSSRTVQIPPPDPWFSGEPINYYYLGYMLHGSIARLAAVPPQFAFNLALATVFSTTVVAAFGVAWNVLRPVLGQRIAVAGGLLAAIGLAVAGNLYTSVRLLQDTRATWDAWWWDSEAGVGWRASRIVCDGARIANRCEPPAVATINEFPFFSFLLGDLHPHLMALPFTVVAIGLTWNLAAAAPLRSPLRGGTAIRVAVSGAVVGALYPLNAWDFPTFLALMALGVFAAMGFSITRAWKGVGLLAVSAVGAWLPFWLRYDTPAGGGNPLFSLPGVGAVSALLGLHLGERTSVAEYLTIFGMVYLAGVALLVALTLTRHELLAGLDVKIALLTTAMVIVPSVLLSAPVLTLYGVPLVLALWLLSRLREISPATAALTLLAFAWALSIGVEIVYVRDAFDSRMNTLFKFYYQTWTLYALAAALAVPLIWSWLSARVWSRVVLVAVTSLAIVAGLAYPVVASHQWTAGFASWQGLDGLAYAEATNPDDVAAIRWLQSVAEPGDVVLEAAGCSYRPLSDSIPFNRVAAFTGVPTVIGWSDNHQRQWRAGQPELLDQIRTREADVSAMFADPSSSLVDLYEVTWLFVGDFERGDWRADCPAAGPYPGIERLGYPGSGWEEAFRSGDTAVYRRLAN